VRGLHLFIAAAAIASPGAAHALTVVVYVDPMTLDKHTRVFNTPGPDRLLVCMKPPGEAGCTELPIAKRR
jgi:hypothetical protein